MQYIQTQSVSVCLHTHTIYNSLITYTQYTYICNILVIWAHIHKNAPIQWVVEMLYSHMHVVCLYFIYQQYFSNTYLYINSFCFKKNKVCVVWIVRTRVPLICGLPPFHLDQIRLSVMSI